MNRIQYLFLLALSLPFVLFTTTPVRSQSLDSVTTDLDTTTVTVSAIRTSGSTAVPFSLSNANVKVLSRQSSGLTLADVTRGVPALEVDDRYNYAVGDRITVRGFGARTQFGVRGVKVLEDDLPLTFPDGQTTLEMVDPRDIASLELLRGPGSSLYGNAAGGVLLLHTLPVAHDPFEAQGSGLWGSNGLQRLGSRLSASFGSVALDANVVRMKYGGYRAHSAATLERGIARIVTPLDADNLVTLTGGYVNFSALSPGALTAAEAQSDPEQANPSSVKMGAGKDGHQGQVALGWKHFEGTSDSDRAVLQANLYGVGRSLRNPIFGKIIDLDRKAGGASLLYSTPSLPGLPIGLSTGFDLGIQSDDRTNYSNNSGEQGALTLDQHENVTAAGLFVELTSSPIARLQATGSLRYDLTAFRATDHFITSTDPDESGDRTMDALSPSIGVLYSLGSATELFANVSTSFETPTTTELANRPSGVGGFNPDLGPMRAIQYEAGARGSISQFLTWDASAFWTNLRDELIPFEVSNAPGRVYYRNAGSSVHRGAELALELKPLDRLSARASLSLIDAYFRQYLVDSVSFSGKKIPGIYPLRLSGFVRYRTPFDMIVTAIGEYSSRTFVNDGNTASAEPFAVFDLHGEYDGLHVGDVWGGSLHLSAGVDNLFDRQYFSSVTANAAANRYYEPAPGRTYFLSATVLFGKER